MFRPHKSCFRGFTLVELLVVIAIIGLITALLYPSLVAARRKANQSWCVSNEHQIGKAFALYVADWDGYWPHWFAYIGTNDYSWTDGILPYIKTKPEALFCPEVVRTEEPIRAIEGYAYNAQFQRGYSHGDPRKIPGMPDSKILYPSTTVSLLDAPGGMELMQCWDPCDHLSISDKPCDEWEKSQKRHLGGANYLFCDGHVKWYLPGAVECWNGPSDEPRNDPDRPSFIIPLLP